MSESKCVLSVLSSPSSPSAIPSRSLITIQHCDNPPTPPPGELSASKFSSSNPAFVGDTSHALTTRPSSRLRRGTSLQRIQSGVPADNRHTSFEDTSVMADSIEHVYKDVVNRVRWVTCIGVCMYVHTCVCVHVHACMHVCIVEATLSTPLLCSPSMTYSSPEQRLIELEAAILQENLDTSWALQCELHVLSW